ncbi:MULTISPECIES: hypothetical protein [Carnobacterium]|uniref:Cell division protein FtsL n=1 Tax=Carnobacterium antarcticum TaxID=2126436 RepID=A0ABW4NM95_9LACT|nr:MULTISPECIES: hypothetical protein [unclassified Carnobacterium]ALV21040.1 hypothetical protein NY10_420 [Carnobacterium sp. CP1]QQP71191.1 hypothetical protein JHE06_05320 [Carnobacterium sp. CS13]
MNKQSIKKELVWYALFVLAVLVFSYGVFSGAKANSLEKTVIENEQEIKVLNKDLKEHKTLMLERDIKLLDKDSTIQSLVAQNEALMWRIPGGSQDE